MRAKPGREQELIALNRDMEPGMMARLKKNGFRRAVVVKTGERSYCFVGEWDSFDAIVKARPDMIKDLDRMRDLLEDLGGGLGVTDPVSGEVVAEM
jgi:hypothetical protein